jgi:hypothetical protein
MNNWRVAVVISLIIFGAQGLQAKEYKGSEGYSLTFPDDWTIADKKMQEDLLREGSRIVQLQDVDLSKISMVAYAKPAKPTPFVANFKVVISNQRIGTDESARAELSRQLREQFSKMGVTTISLEVATIEMAGSKAISAMSVNRFPGLPMPIRQWQVCVPHWTKTYVFTASAIDEDFASFQPQFQQIVSTARLGPAMPFWTIPVMIGVAGGLLVTVIVAKRWPKPAPVPAFAPAPLIVHPPAPPPPPPFAPPAPASGSPLPAADDRSLYNVPDPLIPPATAKPTEPPQVVAPSTGATPPGDAIEPSDAMQPVELGGLVELSQDTDIASPIDPAKHSSAPPKDGDGFIRFYCACGKRVKVPAWASRKKGRCPKCGAKLRAP